MKKQLFLLLLTLSLFGITQQTHAEDATSTPATVQEIANQLTIAALRAKAYPGSDFVIEKTLTPTSTLYNQYIASYLSDGNKINGLLTVPTGKMPKGGWPAIVFNHGYIQPEVYTTTGRYIAYVDALAKSGYVVFKSDFRGHGTSEGAPEGVYYSPAYTIDVLNALASVKKYSVVNPNKIGMWGHSMGGNITLRSLVVTTSVKVAVIWGGVVASYNDIMYHWPDNNPKVPFHPSPRDVSVQQQFRQKIVAKYGGPTLTSTFWKTVDPTNFLRDIKAPIQLHTGDKDLDVPKKFSQTFYNKMKSLKKVVQYYNYPKGNHNISPPNFGLAMQRTISFFDKYLKK